MKFAIPRTPNGIEKAREIRFVDEMDEENEGEERSLKLVSEFGMSANIFYPRISLLLLLHLKIRLYFLILRVERKKRFSSRE